MWTGLDLNTDPSKVRKDLLRQFAGAQGRAVVTRNSFLDLDSHWQALLCSLFRHNTRGDALTCNLQDFCVISLCHENANNGNVVGNLNAPNRLVVMNHNDMHFNPCLPRWVWGRPGKKNRCAWSLSFADDHPQRNNLLRMCISKREWASSVLL